MMLLAIDIGNTNVSMGVFKKNALIKTLSFSSKKILSETVIFDELNILQNDYSINGCIISSVVDELTYSFKNVIDKSLNVDSIIVSNKLILDMNICVEHPEQVGTDRIVNAVGAQAQYSLPLIIIDTGTATTIDVIDTSGDFTGGIIMPGLSLQLNSLAKNTSKLPEVEIDYTDKVIGKNTKEAILSGIVLGHVCAIEGLIKRCIQKLGENPKIIITGGCAELISKYNKDFEINPELTLNGLRIIYEKNT